jgi:hypothetical protein
MVDLDFYLKLNFVLQYTDTNLTQFAKENRVSITRARDLVDGKINPSKRIAQEIDHSFTRVAKLAILHQLKIKHKKENEYKVKNYDDDKTLYDLKAPQNSSGVNAQKTSGRTSNNAIGFSVSYDYF